MSAATTSLQEAVIQQYSKQLRLPTLGGQFARLATQAIKEKQGHLSYLEALLQAEVEERDSRAIARRIHEARFPSLQRLEIYLTAENATVNKVLDLRRRSRSRSFL